MEGEVVHVIVDRKQKDRKRPKTSYNFQKYIPSDLLPPTRPHPVIISEPPK
jgi:hypothetical protein